MLSIEEFLRLQKLAAISLDQSETEKLGKQLSTIVDFLGKLKEVSVVLSSDDLSKHRLLPLSGLHSYSDSSHLFDNATHEKVGNSIVINSVVDN